MVLLGLRCRRRSLPLQGHDEGSSDDNNKILSRSASELDPDPDSDDNREADRAGSGYVSESDSEAELYQQKAAQYAAEGPVKANHAPRTTELLVKEQLFWQQYCFKIFKADADTILRKCQAEIFKSYLHWRTKHSRIKKESAIQAYWKRLSLVYARLTSRNMDEGVLFDIRNWIPSQLTPEFNLDDSEKEKRSMFVEDLFVLLHCHWVHDTEVFPHEQLRLELAAILLFSGFTTTRPAALVGKKPFVYEHIEFLLVRNPASGQRPWLAMKITLAHVKKSGGKSKAKKFVFHEEENLVFCPVSVIMALALVDNAFEADVTTPEQVFQLEIPAERECIRLKWKARFRKTPVFRDIEKTPEGTRISPVKALQYPKYREYLVRLGRTAGFEKSIEHYDLRRASGKKIHRALTAEERNQTMGHQQGGGTYERYYMPGFIDADCQGIYLGNPPRNSLVEAVGRIGLTRDRRAPTVLNQDQREEIKNHPEVIRLRRKRDQCTQRIYDNGFHTVPEAVGTEWYFQHKAAQAAVGSKISALTRKRREQAIQEFHDTIDTIEVNKQLQGTKPQKEILAPSTMDYELKERAVVARLLLTPLDNLVEQQVSEVRVQLIKSYMQLCIRQESPRRYRALNPSGQTAIECVDATAGAISRSQEKKRRLSQVVEGDPQYDQKRVQSLQLFNAARKILGRPDSLPLKCPFCSSSAEVGSQKRNHAYSRIDCLRKHIREQHLQRRPANKALNCPFERCPLILESTTHFLNHAARQHGLFL